MFYYKCKKKLVFRFEAEQVTSFPLKNHNPPKAVCTFWLNREKVMCQKGGWGAQYLFFFPKCILIMCVYIYNIHTHTKYVYVKALAHSRSSLLWAQILALPFIVVYLGQIRVSLCLSFLICEMKLIVLILVTFK